MKVAVPEWQGRISPVFDVAARLVVAEVEDGTVKERQQVRLMPGEYEGRAKRLAELGIGVLICGALSWPLEMALAREGVEVISQRCGDVEAALDAFAAGALGPDAFLMPGCCGRRRFRHQRRGRRA
jgi:predicted Fe-Mo cluster-binding NifX family protein